MPRALALALAAPLALALAACSAETVEPESAADAAAVETAIPVEPDQGIGDGAGPPGTGENTIPVRFRGVWDYREGECMPASDLRMDIRADEIEFYESLGRVTSVEVESPDAIVVALDMSGEGETWQVVNRFELSEDGAILTPLQTEDNSQYQLMPRKRCPA